MTGNGNSSTRTKGFLEERSGVKSNMRLMSTIALIASIAFGAITITGVACNNDANAILVTFGFLIAAFAPKALQKFAEEKLP